MLAKILKKYPSWVLIGILAMTIYSGSLLPRLQVELDFSNYLPSNSQSLDYYDQYREVFGSKDDLLTIGIHREEGIFDSLFLREVARLTDSCKQLPLVRRVSSLTNLSIPRKTIFGVVSLPLIHLDQAGTLSGDSSQIANTPLLKDRYISGDFKTTTVILSLDPDRDIELSTHFINQLDALLLQFAFEETHLAGLINMEVKFARLSQQELQRFIVLTLLMIMLILWMIYRSLFVVVLSMGVFLLSLVHLGGFLVLADLKLDVMATMIPSIILIVSVSDAIHIFSKYSLPEQSAFSKVDGINEVAKTNFLTSLTTAVGFFTLMLSPMPMLYYFGLYVGMGVLLAYFISILFIPAVLFLSRAEVQRPKGFWASNSWKGVASRLYGFQQNQSRMLVGICLGLVILSGWGISLIDTNRTIAGPMPIRHSVVQSFRFFDREMAGARDYELAITAKDTAGLLNLANLRMIEQLENYLDSLPEIGGLLSPVSYYKFLNSYTHAGNTDYFVLPNSDEALRRLDRGVPVTIKREFRSVIDSSRANGAIRGRMPDMGKDRASELMEQIDHWIVEQVNDTQLTFQHTGTAVILDLVNDIQVQAMFKGLGLAILCISLIIALLYFDWRLVAIIITSNLVPLLIVAGLMGFLGIQLRGGTSIIFTIAFVIAVDDTIHFINNVFFRKRNGMNHEEAIRQTLEKTGLPIVITSVVILMAFSLLISSGFGNVKHLGILVSLTIVFALFSDLLLVPFLLNKWRKI